MLLPPQRHAAESRVDHPYTSRPYRSITIYSQGQVSAWSCRITTDRMPRKRLMSNRSTLTVRVRKASPKAQRRFVLPKMWPSVRSRRRALRAFRKAPRYWQCIIAVAIVFAAWLILNWVYQALRKPSELLFPVSGVLYKTPPQTWRQYGPLFEKYATPVMTPELLAAFAQVEGSGNPVVRTYWRWSWRLWPFDLYRPASSAVGMYQITDGTFAEARRYCIHDHQVIDDGPWNAWQSCWFNSLYTRVVPGHAVELTSAYLHHQVTTILARRGIKRCDACAEAGSGGRNTSVWRWSRGCVCEARVASSRWPALRRS